MKKFILLILVSLIICGSLCFGMISAYATIYSDWTLGENAEYLTHDGDTYYPVFSTYYFEYGYYTDYSTMYTANLKFADDATKEKYSGSTVHVSKNTENYCVEVDLGNEANYNSVIYVREDCMEEYKRLYAGEGASYFVRNWYNLSSFEISNEEFEAWKSADAVTIPENSVYKYTMFDLYAYNKTKRLSIICGNILYDKDNSELYIMHYSDIDRNKLYGAEDTLKIYKLQDGERKDELIEFCNTTYEDELEWMNPGPVNMNLIYSIGIALFCVVPIMILALSIVMFFVLKNRSYRKGLVIMGAGSVLMLIAFVLLLIVI